jgi:hypothetical protein
MLSLCCVHSSIHDYCCSTTSSSSLRYCFHEYFTRLQIPAIHSLHISLSGCSHVSVSFDWSPLQQLDFSSPPYTKQHTHGAHSYYEWYHWVLHLHVLILCYLLLYSYTELMPPTFEHTHCSFSRESSRYLLSHGTTDHGYLWLADDSQYSTVAGKSGTRCSSW